MPEILLDNKVSAGLAQDYGEERGTLTTDDTDGTDKREMFSHKKAQKERRKKLTASCLMQA
jgi:hypothetical protein